MMTIRAGDRSMLLTGVEELRIVLVVALRESKGKRKKEKGKNRDCDQASYHLESSFFFLPFTFYFFLVLLRRRLMTCRRLFLTHIRRVAIGAGTRFPELRELVFDRSDLRIRGLLVVLVARRTRGHRNVGRESAQRRRSRDVDVTSSALLDMVVLAAFVTEHRGLTWRQIDADERRSRLMASGTVVTRRLQIFPMTVETRVMRMGHGLVKPVRGRVRLRGGHERHNVRFVIRLMTD